MIFGVRQWNGMLSKKKQLAVLLLLGLSIAGYLFVFFGAQRMEPYTLQEGTCIFDNLPVTCLDSSVIWREGISFFDSLLVEERDTLEALRELLFEKWNLKFHKDSAAALSSIFPLEVLSSKTAGCMGVSWLALMVAERYDFSLEVIMLPNHVFLRYKGINFEPNRGGFSYSNKEYAEKYKDGVWTGLEWKPLSKKEFMGLSAFNKGNAFMKKDPQRALTWYKLADVLFPDYPGISANQKWVLKNLDAVQ